MENKNKNQNCNGYESVYLFLNEEDFQKHLEVCENCRKEHEKMLRVSELIQEAKPYIKAQKKKNKFLKVACALSVVCFSSLSIPFLFDSNEIYNNIAARNNPSMEELGFPVDEYGFLVME